MIIRVVQRDDYKKNFFFKQNRRSAERRRLNAQIAHANVKSIEQSKRWREQQLARWRRRRHVLFRTTSSHKCIHELVNLEHFKSYDTLCDICTSYWIMSAKHTARSFVRPLHTFAWQCTAPFGCYYILVFMGADCLVGRSCAHSYCSYFEFCAFKYREVWLYSTDDFLFFVVFSFCCSWAKPIRKWDWVSGTLYFVASCNWTDYMFVLCNCAAVNFIRTSAPHYLFICEFVGTTSTTETRVWKREREKKEKKIQISQWHMLYQRPYG